MEQAQSLCWLKGCVREILGESDSHPRVMVRFITHSSPVDWDIGGGDMDDARKATGVARAGWNLRKEVKQERRLLGFLA